LVSTEDGVIPQFPESRESATRHDAREELRRVAGLLGRIPQDQRDALTWTVIEGEADLQVIAARLKEGPEPLAVLAEPTSPR